MNTVGLLVFLVFIISLLAVISTIHTRHRQVGKKLFQARFIRLPGRLTFYYPEQSVDLKNWVGSKIINVKATVDGRENPEIEASIALKALGLFPDYELKKKGEHWILFKKAREEKVFSFGAFYRISPWSPATEH